MVVSVQVACSWNLSAAVVHQGMADAHVVELQADCGSEACSSAAGGEAPVALVAVVPCQYMVVTPLSAVRTLVAAAEHTTISA